MKNKEFAKFFKEKEWTQKEAAENLGVSQSRISEWNTGKRPIPLYIEKLINCIKEKENGKRSD